MSSIKPDHYNLIKEYQAPINDTGQFICPDPSHGAARSKKKWAIHMKQYHKDDYDQILASVRVLNCAVSSIQDDDDNDDERHATGVSVPLFEKTTSTTITQDYETTVVEKIKYLTEARKKGDISVEQFLIAIDALGENQPSA